MIDKYQQLALRDRILYNKTIFCKGDIVVLIRKKSNGYPKKFEFDKEYVILNIIGEQLGFNNPSGIDFYVNKTFFTKKGDLRDSNLEKILKNI
jgi:hypothetical protein